MPVQDYAPLGVAPLDSFTGVNDDAKMAAALSYIGAQTVKPALVLAARQHTFSNTYPLNIPGFRMRSLVGRAREFAGVPEVVCPVGGLFTLTSGVKDFGFDGLLFTGHYNTSSKFIADAPTTVLTDFDLTNCGLRGFASILNCKILRVYLADLYIDGAQGTQFNVGGSDNTLFDGMCFMSGSQMPKGLPFIRFGSMSQTRVGSMYCTPTDGYGIELDQGDDAEGLIFYGWRQTAYGQNGPTAPTGAGIRITGGQATTFYGLTLFNANANADGKGKGDIEVTGGTGHVFDSPVFVGTHEGFQSPDLSKPAIYTTVPIVVRHPRAVGGRPAVMQQSQPGLIEGPHPGWQVITAA